MNQWCVRPVRARLAHLLKENALQINQIKKSVLKLGLKNTSSTVIVGVIFKKSSPRGWFWKLVWQLPKLSQILLPYESWSTLFYTNFFITQNPLYTYLKLKNKIKTKKCVAPSLRSLHYFTHNRRGRWSIAGLGSALYPVFFTPFSLDLYSFSSFHYRFFTFHFQFIHN